mgnify:CR=1 FL=1
MIADASPSHLERLKEIGIPKKGRLPEEVVTEMAEQVYAYGYRSEHPRFWDLYRAPLQASWLGDIMTSALTPRRKYGEFPGGLYDRK